MKLRQLLNKKCLKKCFIIVGLFIAFVCLYILSFICGKPTIDTDYLAQLNQINRPENLKQEDNAWPYYEKAFELFKDIAYGNDFHIIYEEFQKDFSDFNDIEKGIITGWLEQNQPAWQEFLKASLKPYCYSEYAVQEIDSNEPFINFIELLDVPTMKIGYKSEGLRDFYLLGRWRIKIEAETGKSEQAIEDCFTLLNIAHQWNQGRYLIDDLVGLHCNSIGNEGLLEVISKSELSLSRLEEIQRRLTEVYESHHHKFDFEGEKLMFLDIIQHVFTKGGLGGGHIIPKYISPLVQYSSIIITMSQLDNKPSLKERSLYLVMSLLHARRNKTIAKYNEIFDQLQKIQEMTLSERKQYGHVLDTKRLEILNYIIHFDSTVQQSRYFIVNIFTPGMERMTEFVPQKKAEYEAAITILALKRYFLENGEYPEALEVLQNKGYISKLPMDPYSDKSLIYKKAGNNFTLYSIGENFIDNGGEQALTDNGQIIKWGRAEIKTGDAVFWPVP